MRARTRSFLVAAFIISMGCGIGPCGPATSPTSGDLYYTRYSGTPNLKKVHFDFDGTHFKLSKPVAVATLPYADGVVFAPDGTLLVGGGGQVFQVHPSTGKFSGVTSTGASYHMAIDPSGNYAWSGGTPGPLARFGLNPLSKGKVQKLSGDDTDVTSIAFDGSGHAFYTASGPGGGGNVGTIDLSSGKTHRVLTGVPASHGMVYDSYSGLLVAFGGDHVAQIDPSNLKIVSQRTVKGVSQLDQGTADGKGHIFVADNYNGKLLFIDFSQSKRVGDKSAFVATAVLDQGLDDVAPLSGPGSRPTGGPFGLCAPAG